MTRIRMTKVRLSLSHAKVEYDTYGSLLYPDPATYFDDDQEDGIKGQDIVYPDAEDLTDIIRMDESKFHYNTFYEPRDS
jgi:hypothetical protein